MVDQVAQETVGGEGMALSGRVKWEVLKVVECLCWGGKRCKVRRRWSMYECGGP